MVITGEVGEEQPKMNLSLVGTQLMPAENNLNFFLPLLQSLVCVSHYLNLIETKEHRGTDHFFCRGQPAGFTEW